MEQLKEFKTVKVEQGFEVILKRRGHTRQKHGYSITSYYGERPRGRNIYHVPVFEIPGNPTKVVIGRAIDTGFRTPKNK